MMEFVRLDHHPVPIGENIKFHGSKPPTSFYHSTDRNGNIKKPLSIARHHRSAARAGHRSQGWCMVQGRPPEQMEASRDPWHHEKS